MHLVALFGFGICHITSAMMFQCPGSSCNLDGRAFVQTWVGT